MARPTKYTDEQRQRIESYKGRHAPGRASAELRAEGIVVSRSTIIRMWDALEPGTVTETVAPNGSVTLDIDVMDVVDDDLPKILREAIRDARGATRAAKADARDADMTKHQDRLFKAIALLDKITPTPPPDPNANPLVKVSAEKCITKLHELLDRVRT
jgi:hypothetical protein